MMKRRAVIGSGGLWVMGRGALAQPARKIPRIGLLVTGLASEAAGPQPQLPNTRAFLRGLSELGYVYGQDYMTEVRGAEGKPDRYPVAAAELVQIGVDVIVAAGPSLPSVKQATTTIPVVMSASNDPVAEGLIKSLSHPGGNFTGLSHQFAETTGKMLELIKELVPGPASVAVLWDRGSRVQWLAVEAAARSRGWSLLSLEIKDAGGLESAFKAAVDARSGALFVPTGQVSFPNRKRIAELAARSRLPAIYDLRPYADAGGLISYGADLSDIWRQAARFVDKILKGAKPADLPVEQPTKFELVINLKTAKALGLTIPQSVRLRADEIIE
jgi:putative tryptophan/tyrosine transport system substrate-binding protein